MLLSDELVCMANGLFKHALHVLTKESVQVHLV
jgi:hypothetical protein